MGLADECVPGAGTSTGVAAESGSVSSSGEPGTSTSSAPSETSDASSSSTTTASTSTGGVASSSSSSSTGGPGSSSGGPDPLCTVYDFDGRLPFDPLNPGFTLDVQTVNGTLLAQWMPLELDGAGFVVADPIDVSQGSFEVEFAAFPGETGTVLSASWEDADGYIVSAIVDGSNYVVSHYDPVSDETIFPGVQPHLDRTRLRMRSADALLVIEADGGAGFETIVTLDTADPTLAFDPVAVEATVFFNRYESAGMETSIALESVTSCASP